MAVFLIWWLSRWSRICLQYVFLKDNHQKENLKMLNSFNCSILEEWLALGPIAYIWHIRDGISVSRRLWTLIRAMIKPASTWLFLNPGVLLMQKVFEIFWGNSFQLQMRKQRPRPTKQLAQHHPTVKQQSPSWHFDQGCPITMSASAGQSTLAAQHQENAPCLMLRTLLRCKMDVGSLPGLAYIRWTLQDFTRVAYYCFSSSLTFPCLFFWPLVSLSSY